MYNGYTIATLSSVVRQGGTVVIATAASAIRQDGTQVIDSGFSGATGSYNDYRHSDTAALVLGTTGGGNVYGQCPWGRGTMVTTALVSWGGGGGLNGTSGCTMVIPILILLYGREVQWS